MKNLGSQIKKLRRQGLSYSAISKELNCSRGSIHHHLHPQRKKIESAKIQRNFRQARLKMDFGGRCLVCGYEKCLEALEFDHLLPKTKRRGVSNLVRNYEKARREAEKCVLLCCRCHRERHMGIIDLGAYLEPSI